MWYVHETECFPCAFKVNRSPNNQYVGDNAPCHFFPTKELAQAEANRRTAHDKSILGQELIKINERNDHVQSRTNYQERK